MNCFKLYHIGYKLYLAIGFEKMSIQLCKTVKRFTRRTKPIIIQTNKCYLLTNKTLITVAFIVTFNFLF